MIKYAWFLIRSTGESDSRKIIMIIVKRIRMEHIYCHCCYLYADKYFLNLLVHKHIYNEMNDDDQFDYMMTVVIILTTTTSLFHQ